MPTLKRRVPVITAAALVGGLLAAAAPATAAAPAQDRGTYVNPVSKTFADTYADPSIIRGKDGYWYAYGTSDPLKSGGDPKLIPISRSRDLTHWDYVGDVFSAGSIPSWADNSNPDERAGLWAPDIRYLNGKYYLYYVVTETTVTAGRHDNAIGVATAPSPTGPWTDSGGPIVGPRHGADAANPDDFLWTFDPSEFTDTDGTRYLYYGSYYGGISVTRLSADGMHTAGTPTQVAIDNKFEGAYVVRHGGYYYLFGSMANCCAGPTTGYSVATGRSRSPLGPFVDRDGISLTASRAGGTLVIEPNGNKWVGPGHNAIVTDLSGQDWFVYHAINRHNPYLTGTSGIPRRPMLLDRLDWIGGWPTVRAGRWASATAQKAPVTSPAVLDSFNRTTGLGADWRQAGPGRWQLADRAARATTAAGAAPTFLLATSSVAADRRVEADLRSSDSGTAGIVSSYRGGRNYVAAWLDRAARALVVDVVADGLHTRASSALPANFDFANLHNLAVETRGGALTAFVTEARLHDPVALVTARVPAAVRGGAAGVAARNGTVVADNVSAAALAAPAPAKAPVPTVGTTRFVDNFNGTAPAAGWTWVRKPAATVVGGVLNFPVQKLDITGGVDPKTKLGNDASLLVRKAPAGNYVVETKVTTDFGVDAIHNFAQGGLIAYDNDNLFARLSTVSIWDTRQVEFGKEMPYGTNADGTPGLSYGGMIQAPPGRTTWLRLAHHMNAAGEHLFRAGVSRNGTNWAWGGVWTLPAGQTPRIGVLAHGLDRKSTESFTAKFDYVKVSSGGSWGF